MGMNPRRNQARIDDVDIVTVEIYLASMTTHGVILIEADNPSIAMVLVLTLIPYPFLSPFFFLELSRVELASKSFTHPRKNWIRNYYC